LRMEASAYLKRNQRCWLESYRPGRQRRTAWGAVLAEGGVPATAAPVRGSLSLIRPAPNFRWKEYCDLMQALELGIPTAALRF
jgi:hypothetical protein